MRRIVVLTVALSLVTSAALAQSTVIGVTDTLAGSIRDVTVTILSGVVAAFLGWVSYWIKTKFGIDIEAKHRDALQAFITRQASSLIAQGAVKLEGVKVDVKSQPLADAARLALNAIPDALAYFNLTPSVIASMIVDMIPKQPAVATAQAVAIDAQNPGTPAAAGVAGVKP